MRKNNIRNRQKEPAKTSRIMVRLTDEEYERVRSDAELSGLTVYAYARKRLNGEHPKRRMSEDEIAALSSFSDARGDIVKLFNFLRSKPHDERERINAQPDFPAQVEGCGTTDTQQNDRDRKEHFTVKSPML